VNNYEFEFTERGPYGAALRLLRDGDLHGRVVLDLGCGAAAVATPVSRLGAVYVGVDVDPDAVEKLVEQGFEGYQVDLTEAGLEARLREVLDDRPLAAVLCLDVLEHVPQPQAVLDRVASLAAASPGVELVVSIPNVAHVDIARRLLIGEWETTDSGLLDRTHVRFLTDRTLTELMAGSGWYESARLDFRLERSDQNKAGHPVFESGTNLSSFIEYVRFAVDDSGTVNQFVRRYHRGSPRRLEPDPGDGPLISVVVRTQGRRPETLTDVLCCLAAQTCLDFEILLVVHDSTAAPMVRELVDEFEGNLAQRVRMVPCDGGTRARPANVGLREAAGEYVVFLDDDDLVTADWVENIRKGATAHPGMVVRWWAAEQERTWSATGALATHAATGPMSPKYATRFDLIRHIRQNETPFHCFAFPRALLSLGLTFDEALTVCEDWAFLVQAASLCGVHDTKAMTSIYNKWSEQSSSHAVSAEDWSAMRARVHIDIDDRPILLPQGSIRYLDRMLAKTERLDALETEAAALRSALEAYRQVADNAHQALTEIKSSTSWKFGAPVRLSGNLGRRLLGRLRRNRST
jgi:2-polyprenyl-3-methyl-5-hydroxy-6-metoxy-1,4-benzoquinol methylase